MVVQIKNTWFWILLIVNLALIGAFMNYIVIKNNNMLMPVFINEPENQLFYETLLSEQNDTVHKLYFNSTTYLEAPYFLLGDVFYLGDWFPYGSGWFSLGDLYMIIAIAFSLCLWLSIQSLVIMRFVIRLTEYLRSKGKGRSKWQK